MTRLRFIPMCAILAVTGCGDALDSDSTLFQLEQHRVTALSYDAGVISPDFFESLLLRVSGYTQKYPPHKRKVFEKRFGFRGQQEATLIYHFTMKDGFEFVKGGKLPGLAGGTATTGCDPVDPGGWSMRYMWQRKGKAVVYAYHADRASTCGDSWDIGNFVVGKKHSLEQYIRINAPGQKNGVLKIWLDGALVLSKSDIRFRGNVNSSVALVDTFLRSTFYGGSNDTWAPTKETSIQFGDFQIFAGSLR